MRPRIRSLRTRLLWGTVLALALVMTAVMGIVDHRQRSGIVEEVQRRGEVLARSLAATSTAPLLLYNFTALEQNVVRVATEDDVVYAIVLDADGRVAAHSLAPDRVGQVLDGAVHERAARAARPLVQDAVAPTTGEAVYDVTVPVHVERQKWGVARVGLSRRRMEAEIRWARLEVLALTAATLLVGGAVAALVARRIAEPVRDLATGVAAIARGDLEHRIVPSTADEIGDLATAFNDMTGQLRQQRADLQEAHGELARRFDELVDLKSYTDGILNSLTTGIVTVDLEGRIVTLNPAAELLTGFFRGEVTGRYCTEVFAGAAEIGDALMETLAGHAAAGAVPIGFRRRNGRLVPLELSTAPLRGGDGKELGAIAILRDLTAVRALEEQLRRSDRLAALGTVAAGLAHEIKNPLTSLITFTRHLPRRFDDARFRERFQSVVPRELERINDIVDRLLELARPARLRLTSVRLPALLDRAVELFTAEIEAKRLRVAREYARGLPPVQADEDALYRALVNLVANALDATGPGGRLTLRAGWSDGSGPRAGRLPAHAHRVRIEVEDTGSGIPPAAADHVFTPFFTTKQAGTGLGLALSHKIVEDHGGTINFTSRQGAGTTFWVILPLVGETGAGGDGEEAL